MGQLIIDVRRISEDDLIALSKVLQDLRAIAKKCEGHSYVPKRIFDEQGKIKRNLCLTLPPLQLYTFEYEYSEEED